MTVLVVVILTATRSHQPAPLATITLAPSPVHPQETYIAFFSAPPVQGDLEPANDQAVLEPEQAEPDPVQPVRLEPPVQSASAPQPARPVDPPSTEGYLSVWPPELQAQAQAVAKCESGEHPNSVNTGGYYGLFQLSPYWFTHFGADFDQWSDPIVNSHVAYQLWQLDGWSQWECTP